VTPPILDAYSQTIADALFLRWPEWKAIAEINAPANAATGYLSLELKPKNPKLEKGLYIVTDGEAIVGFDYYHSHLDGLGENNPGLGQRTVEFIESILEDRLLAVSWWVDGQMRIGSCSEAGVPIEKSPFVTGDATCRIRSWSGKHDADRLYP